MDKSIFKKEIQEISTVIGREVICDGCKKVLGRKIFNNEIIDRFDYYIVTTGHCDWGNDSDDSINEYVYCKRCLYEAFNDYLSRSSGKENTKYFDVEHKYDFYTEEV